MLARRQAGPGEQPQRSERQCGVCLGAQDPAEIGLDTGQCFGCVSLEAQDDDRCGVGCPGKAKAIEETSVEILTSGRPLTVWPEGTVTRDPQKWPMSMKNGVGVIALESSRRLGCQVPLYCAVTWGAASINHWWPWPRKNVVMCYDEALDYADLLDGCDSWGDEVPTDRADELTRRIRVRMTEIMAEIRGEQAPDGYWDYRTMSRVKD